MSQKPVAKNILTLADLTHDPKNANKGTLRGRAALEDSLRQLGAGRSILIDRHGTIIAGNKTVEVAADAGLDDIIVVPTDGTKLVAVQRLDLDLATDPMAKRLAIADNRVGQLDLDFDVGVLIDIQVDDPHILDGLFDKHEMDDLLKAAQFQADPPPATTAKTCTCPQCGCEFVP